ncbi:XdhC family protein [Agrobacterium tumefaciens]|uniref:XdhC family protein n=1 Tax=Agrobacterium tumefaciens TaxID=358 RepID=UPI0021D29D03|nr:XdhC family protein [Agrobacterium tumefaciens]UXS05637.1 XdhC family protein [Agrobacterium tumefaciens]
MADDPLDLIRFAIDAYRVGQVALATLVDIRGGAARSLGSHVVVAEDGRYCGYVSGGCVEAAVAAEALLAMAEGRDRVVKFGEGSRYFDIRLPCGGGISVAIHCLRDIGPLEYVARCLSDRRPVGLQFSMCRQSLSITGKVSRPKWSSEEFTVSYRPKTRIVLCGQMGEKEAVKRLALVSGYDVVDDSSTPQALALQAVIDRHTAVVLLHHDIDAERDMLMQALRSPAFYIGALGSSRTHHRRVKKLTEAGYGFEDINRIKAPIGLFGPTRDIASLAISVIADVSASRLEQFG